MMAVSVLGPAAATALLLLTTIPGEAFVFHMAPSPLFTLAPSREVSLLPSHSYSAWRRPAVSGRRQEQLRRYCTKRPGGVASLRAEVLPEGGVSPCVIKVVGVGGGGGNAVVRMTQQTIPGVEFWCLNTDAQAINRVPDSIKTLQIGNDVTRGLGAGGMPDIGKRAAEESRADIAEVVAGADMVFVTAGMGGGTGSGAAPIVAEVAKEMGALTVGVVTKPFGFEGRRRMSQAITSIAELRDAVDTLIVVANDKLLEITAANIPLERAFSVADDILRQGVVGISEIIVRPGIINVDFADVRSVMSNAGTALMGIGRGEGKTKAEDAAAAAISSPLLDEPIDKAKGIVFNIVGGNDMSLQEINAAAEVIYANVDPTANIIFGALVDERMEGEMSITVLATGFQTQDQLQAEQAGYAFSNKMRGGAPGVDGVRSPMSQQGGMGGYGQGYGQQGPPRQVQQQQQQPKAPPRRPQPPQKPAPGYRPDYKQGQGPPSTPPPSGGGPSDIPDFLTRLKRSQR